MRLPRGVLGGALGIVAALAVWEGAARALEGTYLLAAPADILRYIIENAGLMARAAWVTGQSAAWGYLWGNLVAVALATLAVLWPQTERAVRVLSLVVFCLPLVATGPILRVLYGPGVGPQVTLAALSVFYTTLVPLLAGLRAVPQSWLDLVASYGRGRWTALTQVRAMAALPYLVAGLQVAAPAAFLGAMIGEFTGAERGMGVLALRAMRSLDVDATWALATVAALISIALWALAGQVGRLAAPGTPPVLLAPPPEAERRRPVRALAAGAGMAAAVVALWWAAMEGFGLNAFFAKRPGDVLTYLAEAGPRAELITALSDTLRVAVPGYVAGLGGGAALAAACVVWPAAARIVLPLAVTLRAVPIVTTAPLIVLALGRGPSGVVAIVAVMIFFPALIAGLHGMRLVPGPVRDVFDSYAAGRGLLLLYARLPAALPALFAAARMSVPAAVLAATVAEWLATGTGVGNLMALSASTSNYNMLWSAVAALTLVSLAAHGLVALAERAVFVRYAPEQMRA